jgi:hypothetical protein
MAISKKGSRSIVVNGHRYRWAVSTKVDRMELVAEYEGKQGQRLVARGVYHDGWLAMSDAVNRGTPVQQTKVMPHAVRTVIERALLAGWNPFEKGSDFKLSYDDAPTG